MPADAFEPYFGPCVCVGLSNDQMPAHRIQFAALVTENNSRREPGRTHHYSESGCVVFAKSAPGVEQEAVDRVVAQRRRLERVKEFFFVKFSKNGVYERLVRLGNLT